VNGSAAQHTPLAPSLLRALKDGGTEFDQSWTSNLSVTDGTELLSFGGEAAQITKSGGAAAKPAKVSTSPTQTTTTSTNTSTTTTPTSTNTTSTASPTAPTSGAYAFEGGKWGSTTITWSFANNTYTQDSTVPFSSSIGVAYQSTIQQAFQRWAAVSGLTFVQQADTTDPAKAAEIRIGWGDLGTPSTYQVGYTSYHYTGSTFTSDTVVRLEDPAKDALIASSTGGYTYQGFTTNLYQTALHEIGHALGLGHSTDVNAVMYPTLGTADLDLDSNDVTGIKALYGTTSTGTTTVASGTAAGAAQVAPKPTSTTVTLHLSEDAWHGDAQCYISIDGHKLEGVQTITASHALGSSQELSFVADLGTGSHTLAVDMVHAASAGQSDAARHLYIDEVDLNGSHLGLQGAVSGSGATQFAISVQPTQQAAYATIADGDYTLGQAIPILSRS
jgi:predicted Zn-dependent protease